jgi:anti-sigma factor RsiW
VQCAESLRVQAYFDREVDALSAAEIERHAELCPECRTLLADLAQTRARLRRDLDYAQAPPALRARIARTLDAESVAGAPQANPARTRTARTWRTPPFWLGALGGLGTALAASLAVFFLSVVPRQTLLDDVVAAHVRSLLPSHLTDVVSTDHHTVKPWFAGHADVSPVVADFAPQGFRLVGGRTDYFDRQRAAVVVYQHGAHIINVFTWVAGRQRFPDETTRNGYHVACWRVGNLQYCAVSDAGWDELRGLVGLLRDLGDRDAR